MFGAPVYKASVENGLVSSIEVVKGAPCGASWDAAQKVTGMEPSEAVIRMGLEAQFFCTANPANWDFVYQKSPVHVAADIHSSALEKALKKAGVDLDLDLDLEDVEDFLGG